MIQKAKRLLAIVSIIITSVCLIYIIENRRREMKMLVKGQCLKDASIVLNNFYEAKKGKSEVFAVTVIPPSPSSVDYNFKEFINANASALDYFNAADLDSTWVEVLLIIEIFYPKITKRTFIECGASDGEFVSNTIFLEKFKGWNGLLIEADPYYFQQLLTKNRKVYTANVCLSPKNCTYYTKFQHEGEIMDIAFGNSTIKVYNAGNGRIIDQEKGHSGVSEDGSGAIRYGEELYVLCVPIFAVLNAAKLYEIDVFFLDVEGIELDIIKTIPFSIINVNIFVVEYFFRENRLPKFQKVMKELGYVLHDVFYQRSHPADAIFVKRDVYEKSKLLSLSKKQYYEALFGGTSSFEESQKLELYERFKFWKIE